MIRTDPENNETRALLDIVNFNGKPVLEIGYGDGSKSSTHITRKVISHL